MELRDGMFLPSWGSLLLAGTSVCFLGFQTPPGCDPRIAWSSFHIGKGLLSGLEVHHGLRPG